MAIALHSFKVDADGQVRISHTFYARTENAAHELKHTRLPAGWADENTIDIVEEIDALPEADEEALTELLGLEDSDDTDDLLDE